MSHRPRSYAIIVTDSSNLPPQRRAPDTWVCTTHLSENLLRIGDFVTVYTRAHPDREAHIYAEVVICDVARSWKSSIVTLRARNTEGYDILIEAPLAKTEISLKKIFKHAFLTITGQNL